MIEGRRTDPRTVPHDPSIDVVFHDQRMAIRTDFFMRILHLVEQHHELSSTIWRGELLWLYVRPWSAFRIASNGADICTRSLSSALSAVPNVSSPICIGGSMMALIFRP